MLHAWFSGEIIPSLVLDLTRGHRGAAAPAQSSNCTAQGILRSPSRSYLGTRYSNTSAQCSMTRQGVHLSTSSARPRRQEAHSSSDTFLVCTQEGWWLYNTGDQSQLIFPGRVALEV